MLSIVVMLNYLGARHYRRIPLESTRLRQLAPQTVRVLSSITNPVQITVFFEPERDETLFNLLTGLLREFTLVNRQISFRVLNPVRQPAAVEAALAGYKLTALKDKDFVVVESGGRIRTIFANEIGIYRIEITERPGEATAQYKRRLVAFQGEQLLAEAMLSLANPTTGRVYFLQGHGEHDPEVVAHPHGYSKLAELLSQTMNLSWEKLNLTNTGRVPPDCALLIVAGARHAFTQSEIEQVDDYLRRGGRALILLSSMAIGDDSRLDLLLSRWGLLAPRKIVFDPQFSPTGNDLLTAGLNGEHPVTRALLADSPDTRLRLVMPRWIGRVQSPESTPTPDMPAISVLATTSDGAYETSSFRDGVPYRNPYLDRQGRFPLIVAVEHGAVRGVSSERGLTRMIIAGDSLFLDNELIDSPPANRYFASLAASWLLDRPQVVFEGVLPTPVREYRLIMTPGQLAASRWLMLVIIPGAFLGLGLLVWWSRR